MVRLFQMAILPINSNLRNDVKGISMLYTIAVVLLVLWVFGLVTAYTMGGFIHILLVVAIIVILLRIIRGNRL